ncbi:MAG TPA: hypothetical protein VJH24_00045 [Candidatus Bilamarchaeaceae archaeon]|nr:hypothetical protein [Candidatus Bilamarchaeaceae archaeon]
MTNMLSVPLPEELKEEMDRHKDIKWVEVVRQALWEKVKALEKLDEIMAKSKLTEEDVEIHSKKVKKKVWKRHKKELGL